MVNSLEQRVCAKCNQLFWPKDQKGPKREIKQLYCGRTCQNSASQARYRANHPEERKEYSREYYKIWWEANKEFVNARKRRKNKKVRLVALAKRAQHKAMLAVAEANKALRAAGLPTEFDDKQL